MRSVLLDRQPILGALPQVSCPALVVSGTEDQTLPPACGRRMADALPAGRHAEVAGAAHLVPLERSDAATGLVLNFVRVLGPA